jgi:hypothetical protein
MVKKELFFLGELAFFLMFISFSSGRLALAEETQTAPSVESGGSRVSLSYSGLFKGPSLAHWTDGRQPNVNGELMDTNPQSLENVISLSYAFKSGWNTGISGHFLILPIGVQSQGKPSIQFLDPMVYFEKPRWYEHSGWTLGGKLTVQLPVSSVDSLTPNHLVLSVTPAFTVTYLLPGTRLSFSAQTFLRGYVPQMHAGPHWLTYKVFFAPHLSYQVHRKLALTLWVDLISGVRYAGTPFFGGVSNDEVDIQPGLSWDISDSINFSPVLNLYPRHLSWASSSFQASFTARAF